MSNYLADSKKYKKFPYDTIPAEKLKQVHRRLFIMFEKVVNIFEQNNIRYFVCGGTLLGAVTRHGFIPWDDDVDICVIEDDYEKMQSLLLNNLPEDMILQCRETESEYYHGWVKVRDKKSQVFPSESKYRYNGVWIDLYCLVHSKVNCVSKDINKEHIFYLFRRYGLTLRFLKEIFARGLMSKFLSSVNDMWSIKNRNEVYMIRSASNIVVPKELCLSRSQYDFEGLAVKTFSDANAYLKIHYGDDYMYPPPPSQRRNSLESVLINED